jgi:hypothetical protein
MKRVFIFLAVFLSAAVMPGWAQSQPKTVAEIYAIKAKPGEELQWEAALKRLNAWAHQHNLSGPNYTWSVISGEATNQYVIGSFGHDWKDFDTMQKQGNEAGIDAEIEATVAPLTESLAVSYYEYQPDLSLGGPDSNKPPTPLTEVVFYNLKLGGMQPVENAIKQVNDAIKKTQWAGANNPAGWYELAEGGEIPQMVFAINFQNFAGLQEPSPSLGAMLESVYGKPGAQALEHEFAGHIRSVEDQLLQYRPDLSYIPAK